MEKYRINSTNGLKDCTLRFCVKAGVTELTVTVRIGLKSL